MKLERNYYYRYSFDINAFSDIKNFSDEHIIKDVLQDISSNNEKSYLNKVDEWKGLLNNKKHKIVHLENYSDIENLYKRLKLIIIKKITDKNNKPLLETSARLFKFSNSQ